MKALRYVGTAIVMLIATLFLLVYWPFWDNEGAIARMDDDRTRDI